MKVICVSDALFIFSASLEVDFSLLGMYLLAESFVLEPTWVEARYLRTINALTSSSFLFKQKCMINPEFDQEIQQIFFPVVGSTSKLLHCYSLVFKYYFIYKDFIFPVKAKIWKSTSHFLNFATAYESLWKVRNKN